MRRGGRGLLDGERLALARRRHERQHDEVGVGVEEHVLHERVAADAARATSSPGSLRGRARARSVAKRSGCAPGGSELRPRAGRVHEVALHVEHELALVERRARELVVERGFARQIVVAAAAPGGRERGVEREQRASRRRTRRPGSCAARAVRCASRCASRRRCASARAWRCTGASGIGANSPLVVVSSLIGRRRAVGIVIGAHERTRASALTLRVREVLVDERDRHAALADAGRDALHRAVAHVARREHAGHARLEQVTDRARAATCPACARRGPSRRGRCTRSPSRRG